MALTDIHMWMVTCPCCGKQLNLHVLQRPGNRKPVDVALSPVKTCTIRASKTAKGWIDVTDEAMKACGIKPKGKKKTN